MSEPIDVKAVYMQALDRVKADPRGTIMPGLPIAINAVVLAVAGMVLPHIGLGMLVSLLSLCVSLANLFFLPNYVQAMLRYNDGGGTTPPQALMSKHPNLNNAAITGLLVGFGTALGACFLLVPGVIWFALTAPALVMAVEQNTAPVDAIKASIALTKPLLMPLALVAAVAFVLGAIGAIPLGLGVAVVLPLVSLACLPIYRQLTGTAPKKRRGTGRVRPPQAVE